MMDHDDLESLSEDLHFAGSVTAGAVKPRFKTALDLNTFFQTKTARFEVESEGMERLDEEEEATYTEEDDGAGAANARAYAATHSRARGQAASLAAFEDFGAADFFEEGAPIIDVVEDGSVRKMIVKEGSGVVVPENSRVYVHYICTAEGTEEPYDSTLQRGVPFCLDLRTSVMIPGFYLAVKSMRVLEVAKFSIHFDQAFGVIGCPPRIPPSANIQVIMEVLAIVDEKKLNSIPYMTHEERSELGFEPIYACAKDLRMEGNGLYNNKAYWPAIRKYRKAANLLEEFPVICSEDEALRQELLYTLYVNLAQNYLKVQRPQQACVVCKLGLRCKEVQDASCSKIFFRFATAKFQLGGTDDAFRMCKEAQKRDPKNRDILDLLEKIKARKKDEESDLKSMYSNMGKAFESTSKPKARQEPKAIEEKLAEMDLGEKAEEKEKVPDKDQNDKTEEPAGGNAEEKAPLDWEEYQEYQKRAEGES